MSQETDNDKILDVIDNNDILDVIDMSINMSLELSPTKKSDDPMSIETVQTLTSGTNMAISENFESDKPETENEFKISVDQSCTAAKMPGNESWKIDAMDFLRKIDDTPNTDVSISFEEDDDDDNDFNLKI